MSTVIRLARFGTHKRPFYHIVVTDSRNCRDGRFIEKLGTYNPVPTSGGDKVELNKEKFDVWAQKGATPSDTVKRVLKIFVAQKPATVTPIASKKKAK